MGRFNLNKSRLGRLVGAFFATASLAMIDCAFAQDGAWTIRTSSSTVRRHPATAEVNGTIYLVGGASPCSTSSTNVVEAYNPLTDTWSTRAPMPVASQQLAAASINGILYAVGGGTCCGPLANLQAYNPGANSWSLKPSMPTARYSPLAAVANDRLYVMAGSNGFGTLYKNVEAYNPATNSWSVLAPMPGAWRGGFAVAVVDELIYAIGGHNSAGTPLAIVEAFDAINNTWTSRAPIPTARYEAKAGVINGVIYVAGGHAPGSVTTVEAYNPVTNSWTTVASMPNPLQAKLGAAVVNDVLYITGGVAGDGGCPGTTLRLYAFAAASPNQPPTCLVDTGSAVANQDGSFTVTVGETFTAMFIGSDDDGDSLTVAGSIPAGASLSPPIGTNASSPLPANFSWTPTNADAAGNPHVIAVTFADASADVSTCSMQINVNRRPLAVCDGSVTAEAASAAGAFVQLDASASFDPDAGDPVLFHWDVSDLSVSLDNPDSAAPSGMFPIGVTMATLTVADGRGGVDTCDVIVTVHDTTPPQVMVTTNIASLWPPNHTMRAVRVVVTATDATFNPGDIIPLVITVRSDEADDAPGSGDGNTVGDVNGSDGYGSTVNITPLFTFNPALGENGAWEAMINLRAERAAAGDGRAYTIDVTAIDSSLNFANTSCVVVVPHDRRN